MKTNVLTALMSYFVSSGILLSASAAHAGECESPASPKTIAAEQVKAAFAAQQKFVVTFAGYSGAGYEDDDAMFSIVKTILAQHDPARTLVNAGATPDGIGAVYVIAKRLGFETAGIVSTQASVHSVAVSPCADQVYYIEDETWGGLIEGGDELSPTSEVMVSVSDLMVGIGGGAVTRDELLAARHAGKTVKFFAADMNHQRAVEKAQKKKLPPPIDFSGDAAKALQ